MTAEQLTETLDVDISLIRRAIASLIKKGLLQEQVEKENQKYG